MTYPVSDIFHSIQGEGHFVGYPMTFVRLAGCSVAKCHIRAECDEAPWKMRWRLGPQEIVDAIRTLPPTVDVPHADGRERPIPLGRAGGIVCFTGGEPTDHNLIPVVSALRDVGYRVHLETSGVRPVTGLPIEWLTVSPKVLDVDGLQQRSGHTLKIVVRPDWSTDQAWSIIKSLDAATDFFHRYLQPMTQTDGSNNVEQVIALLLSDHNGGGRWALSTQAHRYWNVK